MKKIFGSLVCVAASFALACGSLGGGLKVAYNGTESSLDQMNGIVLTSVVSEAAAHEFVLANYELDPKRGMNSIQGSAKADGNLRVQFTILGEKGSGQDALVRAGEYPTSPGNVGSPYNRVISARIAHAAGGKEERVSIDSIEIKPGNVTITSVTNEEIKGEVDLTDGKQTIRGSFTAKVVAR